MQAFLSRGRFIACATLLSAWLLTLAACNDASDGIVTGQVTFDNEPLTFATVYFVYGDGKDQHRACNLDSKGSYRLEKVPVGPIKIKVVTYPPIPPGLAKASGPNAPKEQKKATPAVKIPSKYNDETKSGLTYDVKPGQHKHDIPLSR